MTRGRLWMRARTRLAAVVLIGSVATVVSAPANAATLASPTVPKLAWRPCASPDQKGFDCATTRVPLSYEHPRRATIHLALIRHRASNPAHRIGTLFFNPGGPGGRGVASLPAVYDYFPVSLRARFDIASWDPRGIGESTAVQCFSSQRAEERFFAPLKGFPVNRAEKNRWIRRFREFGRRCARRNGSVLRHVSTADTARDLNLLRRAVGDPKLNYFGVSYGTSLGATYANLFPSRVRALALDGDVNPAAWTHRRINANGGRFLTTFLRQRSDQGAAKTLDAFLGRCGRADTAQCAFSAGGATATRAKFAALLRRLREKPQSADVTYAELVSKTISALYYSAAWPDIAKMLQDVWTTGTASHSVPASPLPGPPGVGLTASADQAYAGVEQGGAVLCSESPNPGPAGYRGLDSFAFDRSGPAGPYWLWSSAACADWPATAADRYAGPWSRPTANPILLIGNSHDPATPYRGAVAMARQLARARLLTVDGYGHSALLNTSTCANDYESRYFIHGRLPPKGARCSQDIPPFSGAP